MAKAPTTTKKNEASTGQQVAVVQPVNQTSSATPNPVTGTEPHQDTVVETGASNQAVPEIKPVSGSNDALQPTIDNAVINSAVQDQSGAPEQSQQSLSILPPTIEVKSSAFDVTITNSHKLRPFYESQTKTSIPAGQAASFSVSPAQLRRIRSNIKQLNDVEGKEWLTVSEGDSQ